MLGLYHQLGGLLWHCKGIHVKWEDFVLSLNLLGGLLWGSLSQWVDYVKDFITNWEDFSGIAKEDMPSGKVLFQA